MCRPQAELDVWLGGEHLTTLIVDREVKVGDNLSVEGINPTLVIEDLTHFFNDQKEFIGRLAVVSFKDFVGV